jgi:hypothetical protein
MYGYSFHSRSPWLSASALSEQYRIRTTGRPIQPVIGSRSNPLGAFRGIRAHTKARNKQGAYTARDGDR